jgi:hypothetical protein
MNVFSTLQSDHSDGSQGIGKTECAYLAVVYMLSQHKLDEMEAFNDRISSCQRWRRLGYARFASQQLKPMMCV